MKHSPVIAKCMCEYTKRPFLSGRKKQPKDQVSGQDISGTSGTQKWGYRGQTLHASGLLLFFLTGCCFRQGVTGMSRDLGRVDPDLLVRSSCRTNSARIFPHGGTTFGANSCSNFRTNISGPF